MKTILVDATHVFVIKGVGINLPMYELLEKYPNKKILLSNANEEEMVNSGLVDLPYEVFSLKHDPDKNNPKYFTKLLEKCRLTVSDVVYFDHIKDAVNSAQSVGINSYYYDSKKKDLSALKSFLDDNI